MDARAALATIATRKLAFTDPGSIFLDGKNVLSIVVEIDTGFLPGWTLVGVVAETLTRGEFNVRIERVGRPEVKNMMLAPKEFDPVNRDLEIRDLYNMEDAFHLGDSYAGAFRARLDANLAFWDGLDGKQDWPAGEDGSHPLTDLVLADYLVVDVTKPYVEQGSFLEIELAARRGERARDVRGPHLERRRHGHDLHPARQRRSRPHDPRRSRRRHPAGDGQLPLPGARRTRTRPNLPSTTDMEGGDCGGRHDGRSLDLDDIQAGALYERPSPYVGTYLLLGIRDRARRPCAGAAAAPDRQPRRVRRHPGRHLGHGGVHLPGAEGARRAAVVPGQLRTGVPAGDGGPGRDPGRHR